jgi:hypothetical protein
MGVYIQEFEGKGQKGKGQKVKGYVKHNPQSMMKGRKEQ